MASIESHRVRFFGDINDGNNNSNDGGGGSDGDNDNKKENYNGEGQGDVEQLHEYSPFTTSITLNKKGINVETPRSIAIGAGGQTQIVQSTTVSYLSNSTANQLPQPQQPKFQQPIGSILDAANKAMDNRRDIEKGSSETKYIEESAPEVSIMEKLLGNQQASPKIGGGGSGSNGDNTNDSDDNVEEQLTKPATGSLCRRIGIFFMKIVSIPFYVIRYLIAVTLARIFFTPPSPSQNVIYSPRSLWLNFACFITSIIPFGIWIWFKVRQDSLDNPMPLPNDGNGYPRFIVFIIAERVVFYSASTVINALLGASERRGELIGIPIIRYLFLPLLWINRFFGMCTLIITAVLLQLDQHVAVEPYIIILSIIAFIIKAWAGGRVGAQFTIGTILAQLANQVCILIMLF